jgi:hypothetical protein
VQESFAPGENTRTLGSGKDSCLFCLREKERHWIRKKKNGSEGLPVRLTRLAIVVAVLYSVVRFGREHCNQDGQVQ